MIVRPFHPEDAERVATLLRDAFARERHDFLPYCQSGAGLYLRLIHDHPWAYPGYHHYVVDDKGIVIGFAEFRDAQNETVLTYIAVADTHRRQGVARAMMRERIAARPSPAQLRLQVFDDNTNAVSMYESIGMSRRTDGVEWLTQRLDDLDLRAVVAPHPAEFMDFHMVMASLAQYGFGALSVRLPGGEVRLGLPSPVAMRVPDESMLSDLQFVATVTRVLPALHTLYCVRPRIESASTAPSHWALSELTASVEDLRRGLTP